MMTRTVLRMSLLVFGLFKPETFYAEGKQSILSSPLTSWNRSCYSHDDCYFQNPIIEDIVYLLCESGKCSCKTRIHIGNTTIPDWSLHTNSSTTSSQTERECLISQSGPCGKDRGLELKCQAGVECIEGRCRDPRTGVRRIPQGQLCHESIECQIGLECKLLKQFSFYTESYCVQPS